MIKLCLSAAILGAALAAGGAPAQSLQGSVLSRPDEQKVRRLPEIWRTALAEARQVDPGGVRALGKLLDPRAALPRPWPGPGRYRCRTIKLGSQGVTSAFQPYPWFSCRVSLDAGGNLSLTKVTGSQRPSGKLYDRSARQLTYAGSLAMGNERRWVRYGTTPERDAAGVLERIGARRFRVLFPEPYVESKLDVMELEAVR